MFAYMCVLFFFSPVWVSFIFAGGHVQARHFHVDCIHVDLTCARHFNFCRGPDISTFVYACLLCFLSAFLHVGMFACMCAYINKSFSSNTEQTFSYGW